MTDKERFYLCLAEVLRELRAEHGWSVRELSRESGVSERLIRKLERGTDVGRVGAGKIMELADGVRRDALRGLPAGRRADGAIKFSFPIEQIGGMR